MKQVELAKYMEPVFLSTFQGKGKWSNVPTYRVLMSLIRKRPRDLVKICTQAAHQAYDKKLANIGTAEIQSVLEDYSQERLQDTINEYKFELPEIQRLLMGMKPSKRAGETSKLYVFTTAELVEKMGKIAEQGQFRFAGGRMADAKDLAAFLYKINFLTARKDTGKGIIRKYFEENKYIANKFADFGFDWEIHPAYRWALQPDDPNKPFEEIDVSMDEESLPSHPSPRKLYSK